MTSNKTDQDFFLNFDPLQLDLFKAKLNEIGLDLGKQGDNRLAVEFSVI